MIAPLAIKTIVSPPFFWQEKKKQNKKHGPYQRLFAMRPIPTPNHSHRKMLIDKKEERKQYQQRPNPKGKKRAEKIRGGEEERRRSNVRHCV